MKNKTIRKRQIYKNINKNKTKYITGGALSDYFAEIKKGLNAKCISETDVNNVNYMKKQLSELNYKINKMENKNNNECSDTCMREIMRLKYEINKILIFLTSLNLKNILNKNYTIEPDVLAKKSQISTYTNLLTDFLFSENKPEKSVQLEPAKKQNDAVRIASKTAIQTIQSQAHERARQLDAKIKKKPTPIARATDPSPVALAPIAVPLASPIASPVAPRVESPIASPVAPRVESPLASPVETQVSSPQVASPIASIPVATIPVATIPLAPQVVSPTRETTQVAEREARQVASPARETTQVAEREAAERETLERETAEREARQVASPARETTQLTSSLVSAATREAIQVASPASPRVESPLASPLETQVSSPQVAAPVATIPVATIPVAPTRETTQVAEREARQVASPARETTQLTSSLVSAATREAIQIASPASPRVESPLASPLETQVSSPQVAAPVATIPVAPRVESPLASQLETQISSPQVASLVASIPVAPRVESPLASLASPLASPASPLASPASPHASPALSLASPLASPASPASPRVESLPVAPQVVSPTRETTQVAERETERERGIELDEISAKFDAESVISRVPSRVASPILASATREARKVEPAQVSQGSRATRLTSTPLSQGPRVAKLTPIAPAQVSQGSRATRLTSIASAPLSQGPRAERERGIELDEITANFDAESVASRVASPILASIPVATLPLARAVVSRAKRALLINELKAIQDYIPKITTQLPITIQNIYIFLKENETLATALENIDNIDLLKEKKYETLYAIVTNIITLQNNLKYLLHFKSKKKHGFIDTVDLTKLSVSISNLKYKYSKQNINIINYLDDTQKDNLIKVINTNENFWKRGGYNKTIKNKKRVKTYRKNKKNKKNKTIKPLFIYNSLI